MDGDGDYNCSLIKIFLALVLESLCNDIFLKYLMVKVGVVEFHVNCAFVFFNDG